MYAISCAVDRFRWVTLKQAFMCIVSRPTILGNTKFNISPFILHWQLMTISYFRIIFHTFKGSVSLYLYCNKNRIYYAYVDHRKKKATQTNKHKNFWKKFYAAENCTRWNGWSPVVETLKWYTPYVLNMDLPNMCKLCKDLFPRQHPGTRLCHSSFLVQYHLCNLPK